MFLEVEAELFIMISEAWRETLKDAEDIFQRKMLRTSTFLQTFF